MRRFPTGVSLFLSVCALAGGCGAPSSEPLDATTSPRTSQSLDGQTAPPGACQPVGLVKDIAPGAANAIPDYDIQPPAALGRTFFFAANDGTTGLELWKSNGSKDGTVLVKDVFPGSENSDPRFLTGVGGTLFFIAADGAHGRELWKTDGTPEGTVLVKDIRPGTEGSGATGLTAVGGTLFFIADDGVHGPELWKSDGTEAGTVLVKDVLPGAAGSGLSDLVVFKGALYFAADGGPHEAELWKSDGTDAGTERVAVIRVIESDPGEQILRGLTAAGDKLYFFAGSSYGEQWDLWKTDGSGPGTVRVKTLTLGPSDYTEGPVTMTPSGALVFFRAGAGGSLWRSDGTSGGTLEVRHSSDARWLTNLNGKLLFTAWDDASGYELWKSDGTAAGTVLVEDIRPGKDSSAPFWLTVVDGKVLFTADTEENGRELWTTNGTQEGTQLLYDLIPGKGTAEPSWLTPVGPRVFFMADDGVTGSGPWSLNDCAPPELVCPTGLVLEARGPDGAVGVYPGATATDNKPAAPVISYSHPSGSHFPLGTTQATVTATDESGNISRCTFNVTVRDTTAPRLTCPQEQMSWRQNGRGAQVDYPPATATDAVSAVQLTYSLPSGSQFKVGTNLVTVSATDAAGNVSRCAFNVKVSPQYERGGCGCGAASLGDFSGGALLTALTFLAGRRRKSSAR